MQGSVAGLKRKAGQMSGASFGSAVSRGSAASGGSADSKVRLCMHMCRFWVPWTQTARCGMCTNWLVVKVVVCCPALTV